SVSTAGLSVERLITQFEITTSTESAGSGTCSITPFTKCTFVTPASTAFRRASASISSVMSSPYAMPVGPTRLAERITSMPPLEQPGLHQLLQMMRDRWLRQAERVVQLAGADRFAGGREDVHDPHARWVTQRLEQLRGRDRLVVVERRRTERRTARDRRLDCR